MNDNIYQGLDQVVTEMPLGAAKNAGQRKHGYTRSGSLTMSGRFFIIFEMMLDCRVRA